MYSLFWNQILISDSKWSTLSTGTTCESAIMSTDGQDDKRQDCIWYTKQSTVRENAETLTLDKTTKLDQESEAVKQQQQPEIRSVDKREL